jgi:hypothetical protein
LDTKLKLETGLKFAGEDTSTPVFFGTGVTTACFQRDGKVPVVNETLKMCANSGATIKIASLRSHVGSTSREHCFDGDDMTTFVTSSGVTRLN